MIAVAAIVVVALVCTQAWAAMLLIGALHSHVEVVPPIGYGTTLVVMGVLALLIGNR